MPDKLIPLTADLKARWVADLREHPELQGQKRLTTIQADGTEKDCCLGRLCKVAGVPRFEVLDIMQDGNADTDWDMQPTGEKRVVYGDEQLHEDSLLPSGWFDLGSNNDGVDHDIRFPVETADFMNYINASTCNDAGFTFPQLADLIEYFVVPVEEVAQ